MPLLRLPPETISHIFGLLDSSFFASDLRRLTVSKEWYEFAQVRIVEDVKLSQKTIEHLATVPLYESSLDLFKTRMISLNLELHGFEEWGYLATSPDDVYRDDPFKKNADVLVLWTVKFNGGLARLATITDDVQNLRSLRIKAVAEQHPQYHLLKSRNYLDSLPMQNLISVRALTVLDLDLWGTDLSPEPIHNEFHICQAIATLLTTLRSLRVRMRSICPKILEAPKWKPVAQLEVVIINRSLANDTPRITAGRYSARCFLPQCGLFQRRDELENAARLLATQMAAPKMVRVISHRLPFMELEAFDVLNDKLIELERGAEWDAEGKPDRKDKELDADSVVRGCSS